MSSNRLKLLLLSAMAVVAISAIASASASAACLKVAVAGTGHWENSTCTVAGGTKGFVQVEKLETELKAGEWCAKVKAGEPSTFKDSKCTEAETGTGKFIKVLTVSRDEWQTCQEKTGGKFSEHGCATKVETGGTFEWVTLTGEPKKVVSEGKEFKLTSGTKVITCKKVKDEGTITGGSPGTDEAKTITFEECSTSQVGCNVKSAGGTLKTIVVTRIKTTLKQFIVGEKEIEGDIFEQKEEPVGSKKFEFVTLEFEGTCSEFPETKVKGDVVAETAANSGELTFPSTAIEVSPKLEAFGIKATLTGKDTQTLTNGWAIRAI